MQKARIPADEQSRLKALYEYEILDTEAEKVFDDLTQLASDICDTPISLISLVDPQRQWFKSKYGIEATETERDIAFCSHAILQDQVFEIQNALLDERFHDNPLVTNDPNIRFYAGAPLITPQGSTIGTLCVISDKPKKLTKKQISALTILSKEVIAQLELRLKNRELSKALEQQKTHIQELEKLKAEADTSNNLKGKFLANMSHELRTPLAGILAQIQLAELTQDTTQQKALGQAKKSAHRLNTILDNLLVLAHVDADTPLNITEPWELDSLITTVVTESNNNNPRLTYNITASQPVYCIPSAMLTIVCRNLLDNAFKYSKANTPVILAANLTATALKITISNHAHINQADLANMATRFWRKGAANGAGLGLSIVASIAEKYQGSVAFTNDEDRFIVSFNLPIKNVNPQ